MFSRRLSVKKLNLQDEYLVYNMADLVTKKLKLHINKNVIAKLQKLPVEWRYISPILMYESEVNNGGHFQFFWNSDGESNDFVAEGLKYFECHAFLHLFKQAKALYNSQPQEQSARNTSEEEMQAAFASNSEADTYDKQDTQFYQSAETLGSQLQKYILEHIHEYK